MEKGTRDGKGPLQVRASINCTWQEDPVRWACTQEGREVHSWTEEEMRISVQVRIGCFRDEADANRYAHGTADFPYTLDEVLDPLGGSLQARLHGPRQPAAALSDGARPRPVHSAGPDPRHLLQGPPGGATLPRVHGHGVTERRLDKFLTF